MMDPRIKKIGKVLHVDAEGYLVSESSKDNIVPPWDAPVRALIDEYQERLGSDFHSFYIRGSLVRGTAVEGVSDIDGLLLLRKPREEIDFSWHREFVGEYLQQHPFITKLDIAALSVDNMTPEKNPVGCFMLKVMADCVAGQDIRYILPAIKPGPKAFVSRWGLRKMLEPREVSDIPARQVHLAKWILRAGMELVMEDEQCYTRDLYPCYELFVRHYPEYKAKVERALLLALFPTEDSRDIAFLETDIGGVIADLLDKKYPIQPKK